MRKHVETEIQGDGETKNREKDAERKKEKSGLYCRATERKKHKEQELMKKKGVKLTCPAAGGACPPSPGVGLAGLC